MSRKYSAAVSTLVGARTDGARTMMYTEFLGPGNLGVGLGFGTKPWRAARAQSPASQARLARNSI